MVAVMLMDLGGKEWMLVMNGRRLVVNGRTVVVNGRMSVVMGCWEIE